MSRCQFVRRWQIPILRTAKVNAMFIKGNDGILPLDFQVRVGGTNQGRLYSVYFGSDWE